MVNTSEERAAGIAYYKICTTWFRMSYARYSRKCTMLELLEITCAFNSGANSGTLNGMTWTIVETAGLGGAR